MQNFKKQVPMVTSVIAYKMVLRFMRVSYYSKKLAFLVFMFFSIFFFTLCAAFLPLGQAQEPVWEHADHVKARLLSSVNGVGDSENIHILLEVSLDEGWHTYWRFSGEAGLPPVFNWEESNNLHQVLVDYPTPERYEEMGLFVFGYSDNILFPITLTPEKKGKEIDVKLTYDLLVCHEICVPQKLQLSLLIPEGNAIQNKNFVLFEQAQKKVPLEKHVHLNIESIVAGPEALVVNVFSQKGYEKADIFVESEGLIITAPPEVSINPKEPRRAMLKIAKPYDIEDMQKALSGKEVRLIFSDSYKSIYKEFSL